MPPQTIDEVLVELDQIILRARQDQSRLGYFATLYRNVTIKVKEGIAAGFFEDGARMEQLDVTFANRYLSALQSFRAGRPASKCWLAAFKTADAWAPTVLQQLLIGMNAHINFDLGIAAQAVAPGDALPALKTDFNRINDILGGMINRVRADVGEVSPWIRLLNSLPSQSDDRLINFSLNKARASSWLVANMINSTPAAKLGRELEILDEGVARLGALIANPREWLISLGLRVIRMRESNDVPHVIDVLSQT
ncbi:MAG TPA: DUF5995 family protein [Pyrinomonadaceae bacterium]